MVTRKRSRTKSKERAYKKYPKKVRSRSKSRSRKRTISRGKGKPTQKIYVIEVITPVRKRTVSKKRSRSRDCSRGKYANRKSPCESATEFRIGHIARGMDGNFWKIVKASNGVKRWQKI